MRRSLIAALLGLLLVVGRAEAITATLQFPSAASGTTQYGGSFQFAWITVSTDVNATCKWDTASVAYASMGHFFYNTGGQTWHVNQWASLSSGSHTYYYSCSDDSSPSTVTSPTSIQFTQDTTFPGTVARNLFAIALTDTTVKVSFQDPTDTSTTTCYKVYRNGSLVYNTNQFVSPPIFIDTGLTANTIYSYTASVCLNTIEQSQSPVFKVRTLPSGNTFSSSASILKLDDFESGNTVTDGTSPNDWTKYLWVDYPNCLLDGSHWGDSVISTPVVSPAKDGTHAFQIHMTGVFTSPPAPNSGYTSACPAYFEMRPFVDATNARNLVKTYLKTGVWANNTYNRMRLWVKAPTGWTVATGGHQNVEVGTYVKSSHGDTTGAGGEESGVGGNHFYHFFNLPKTDQWYQIIVDTHPSHQRSGPPSREWHNHPYFSGEPNWSYFDALGLFYFDTTVNATVIAGLSYPHDWYFDDVEFFYEDDSTSDIEHVYSIHGGFNQATNTIYVGWGHPRDDSTTKAQIKYSYSDLRVGGWASGTDFPGTNQSTGGLTPQSDVYSSELVSTNAISTTGQNYVYVGVRLAGDTAFRQIQIPLNAAAQARMMILHRDE